MGLNIKKAIEFLNLNGWDIVEYKGRFYTGDTEDSEISVKQIERLYEEYNNDKPKDARKNSKKKRGNERSQFRSLRYEVTKEED
jgi:hypothetical protein